MAIGKATVVLSRATIAVVGTSVAPGTQTPDNCWRVEVTNRGNSAVFLKDAAAGGPIADDGSAAFIPANSTRGFTIGVRADRPTPWATLAVDAAGGAVVPYNVDFAYFCTNSSSPFSGE
jgi:hypothetical protein